MSAQETRIADLEKEVARLQSCLTVKGAPRKDWSEKIENFKFNTIEEALEAIKQGEFVVVLDNEDRENEGDLVAAAELMTPEKMAFMIRHTSGIVCLSLTKPDQERLELPIMVVNNTEKHRTAFTHTVDYAVGTTTGISAGDRSATVTAACDSSIKASEFNRPGHIFPLVSVEGGVLTRMGHTEATSDLCKLAGLKPMGVLCEIVLDNGNMARRSDLETFSREYGLKIITISDLIEYRKTNNI
ncbi:3,4-dihydroxy-2-butanone 4-phosphate synthase [Sphaeroforma arctica JP610]|uniref:3,4-dihydroxy-2-butanone 4-phosphate synthase n=1 Tax=Sphaeroforma arctica JP610 TaxID=667725 RepID=A0A0L0G9Y9_9EUKA|nr:3,4-dihydroxy-2-butanone 4-phosphate synthase [Sphaeroforma arctica JP610]KNC85820.1 3,4-dihydroxy-2-butanone 4-phosphate synthase [Sphaeroforma arctica JP610]|eukprot:XP_014159722.1 3,4-dihydroxy-2-butanone 4-phosphate synthase [Sphaeroforma arctica JP610]